MKHSVKLHYKVDPSIKVGDTVKLTDGSALSAESSTADIFTVYPHEDITGSKLTLGEDKAVVLEVNVQDFVLCVDDRWCFNQDLVVQIGKGIFRTNSTMVKKI